MFFMKILYWIILFGLWVIILKYRKIIYDWTWKFDWAEKYIGNWGTVLVIIMIWLLMIFLSIAYPAWVFDWPKIWWDTQNNNININQNN